MMDANGRIQVGVVGTGFIGPVHVEALRRNGVLVKGLAEITPERAQEKADQLGIPHTYDFEGLIADPEIDVVHLTTPNFLHFPQAKAALEAGKHVVCEKPLAMNSAQGAELVEIAKRTGKINVVNFNIRFYPLIHEARARVQAGELGDLFVIHGSYLQDWLLYDTDWNWRLETEESGDMRAVADIGSHWLDCVTFVSGQRIESVCADFSTFHKIRKKPTGPVETYTGKLETKKETVDVPIKTEDYATIMLRFANGARGALTVSQVSAGRKNRLTWEIDGGKAAMAWESERPNELWIGHRERPNELLVKDPSLLGPEARAISSYPGGHNEGFPDTFKQLYGKVYAAVRAGRPGMDYPTFEDGLYALRLGEAVQKSAAESRWVAV
jgi:predicted dehydrogenase